MRAKENPRFSPAFLLIIPQKGGVLMRRILDSIFKNKMDKFFVPISMAIMAYVVFLIFGPAEDKIQLAIITPIVSVIWFFGVFGVIYFQVKNPRCPEWFLNLLEFLLFAIFGFYAVIGCVQFAASGLQTFNLGICPGFVTVSAVYWAHSKRTK